MKKTIMLSLLAILLALMPNSYDVAHAYVIIPNSVTESSIYAPSSLSFEGQSLGVPTLIESGTIEETKTSVKESRYKLYKYTPVIDMPIARLALKNGTTSNSNYPYVERIDVGETRTIQVYNSVSKTFSLTTYLSKEVEISNSLNFSIGGKNVGIGDTLSYSERYLEGYETTNSIVIEAGYSSTQTFTPTEEVYYAYEYRDRYEMYVYIEYTWFANSRNSCVFGDTQGSLISFDFLFGYSDFVKYKEVDNKLVYNETIKENTIYLADYIV